MKQTCWLAQITFGCVLMCATADGAMRFTDVTENSGIDFLHTDGRSGELRFIETIGSGCAFVDVDNDGWLDIYLVNAGDAANRLYRNNGDGTFEDATERAGVGHVGYGVGVSVADVDADGWLDLFVTNYGENVLYCNNGDGTFEDATERAGLADDRWTTASAFGDIDGDGDLDLYVTRYCKWNLAVHRTCEEQGIAVYCGPEEFEGDHDRLFRNEGDGRFNDISFESGIGDAAGKGLGVLFSDIDADGDQDIYVANDGTPNFLYRNDGNGRFVDVGWMVGVDGDDSGNPQGSMGVDFGDYNRDGLQDLIVTNFQRQYHSLYRNDGGGFFTDASFLAGMGDSLPQVGWGTAFADFNQDGWLDLFVANGHIQERVADYDRSSSYAQLDRLYRNNGDGGFESDDAALPSVETVGRGAAFGDYDNDGDLDILVNNANGPPRLLRNDSKAGNWLTARLESSGKNPYAVGSVVTATFGDATLVKEVRAGGSYASQNDLRVHFGLGTASAVDRLTVRWPSGAVTALENVSANRFITIRERE